MRSSITLKKVMLVVNAPEFFLSHRLPIALQAKAMGYEVHIASADGPEVERIEDLGFVHHVVAFSRSGQNPIREFKTLLRIVRLFTAVKPDLVHLVTIKPVLYGGIAARVTRVKAVVVAVSGLGTVFMANSLFARVRKAVVSVLYRAALKHKQLAVIFQNPDDRDALVSIGALEPSSAKMIRGSGVDLRDYPYVPEPEGKVVVSMAARLLKDKGVVEFVDAARVLLQRGVNAEFWLIGSPDPGNPSSVTAEDVSAWVAEGVVKALGYRKDIPALYSASHIVCLPSYYGEGLPKSLVEAAACGRAVVTTDHVGCRDAIKPNVTGVLVPCQDVTRLADAIQTLAEDKDLRVSMGREGRELAEEAFAIEKIVKQHMSIYKDLLGDE